MNATDIQIRHQRIDMGHNDLPPRPGVHQCEAIPIQHMSWWNSFPWPQTCLEVSLQLAQWWPIFLENITMPLEFPEGPNPNIRSNQNDIILMAALNLTPLPHIHMQIPVGPHALKLKHDDCLMASAYNLPVEWLLTNFISNQQWQVQVGKPNLWLLVTQERWFFTSVASFGTSFFPQEAATLLYEDNNGCTAMGNAQKPASCTRHINIKFFLLCDWVKCDLMLLDRIDTSINMVDHLTKALQPTLFHRHANFLLGHIPPTYSPVYKSTIGDFLNHSPNIDPFVPASFITPLTACAARVYTPLKEDY